MALYHAYSEVENSNTGVPMAGVQVVPVFPNTGGPGVGVAAPIYADESETPFVPANTCLTDETGMYSFYIEPGSYNLDFFIGSRFIRRIEDVQFINPIPTNVEEPYRATLTEALNEFPIGFYFRSDDKNAEGPHPNEMWIYQRIGLDPGYVALVSNTASMQELNEAIAEAEAAATEAQNYGNATLRSDYTTADAESWTAGVWVQILSTDTGSHASKAGDFGASGGLTPNAGLFQEDATLGLIRKGANEGQLARDAADDAEAAAVEVRGKVFEGGSADRPDAFGAIVDANGDSNFIVDEDGTVYNVHIQDIDSRTPETLSGPENAFAAFVDEDGNSNFYTDEDGTIHNVDYQATKANVAMLLNGTALTPPNFAATIEMDIIYGQSLGQGALAVPAISTTPLIGALRFTNTSYNAFTNLVEPVRQSNETPCSGAAAMILQLIQAENGLAPGASGHAFQLLMIDPAEGGQPIGNLVKGSAPYNSMMTQVDGALATKLPSQSVRIRCVHMIHGEADYGLGTPASTYKTVAQQILTDINADVKLKIPDNPDIIMVWSQVASHKWYQYGNEIGGTHPNATLAKDANIAVAQYEMARDNPLMTMSMSQYVLTYQNNDVHLLNWSSRHLGGYHGKAYKRVFTDSAANIKNVFMRPLSIKAQGRLIEIEFNVPVPPLHIDNVLCDTLSGSGFTLRNASNVDVGALTVEKIEPSKISILSPVTVGAGFTLRHAIDGTVAQAAIGRTNGPRSNIRDSAGDRVSFDTLAGGVLPMHNMPPIFTYTF